MTDIAQKFADAAVGLIGAHFQLGGCCAQHGIDCVGVVACALKEVGIDAHRPVGYSLRNASIKTHLQFAEANGFALASGEGMRGDLVLVQPGPAQHHLAISNGGGLFVHAHAGLRKVILSKLPADWPVLQRWRLSSNFKG